MFDEDGRRGPRARLDGVRGRRALRRGRAAVGPLAAACICTPIREVEDAVLLPASTSAGARWCARAIIDKDVRIGRGARIGVDPEADRERFKVSAGGIVVIPKGEVVD